MINASLNCPHCGTRLKLKQTRPDEQITCPACDETFRMAVAVKAEPAARAVVAVAKPDKPKKDPTPPAPRPASSKGMILLACIGGLALVAAACVGAYYLIPGKPAGEKPQPHPGGVALLVGVTDYESLPSLRFAENDVEELAALLREAKYDVVLLSGSVGKKDPARAPTKANIAVQLKNLASRGQKASTVLVGFAGHGLQIDDKSYFCPREAKESDSTSLIPLDEVYAGLNKTGAGTKLLLVDACRNTLRRATHRGLDGSNEVRRPPSGASVLFSCSPGQFAFETDKLGGKGHGVFFHYVLRGLRGEAKNNEGAVTLHTLSAYVSSRVVRTVPDLEGGGARQEPHLITDLRGEPPVIVQYGGGAPVQIAKGPTPSEKSGTKDQKREVTVPVKKDPPIVKKDPPIVKKDPPPIKKEPPRLFYNGVTMKLVLIPAGKFSRTAIEGKSKKTSHQRPGNDRSEQFIAFQSPAPKRSEPREVEITRAFYLGATEVTQKQWLRVMGGKTPSYFSKEGPGKERVKEFDTDDFPVEQVGWDQAVEFCKKLSDLPEEKKAGRVYRLPTEAEWEYACRAGTTTDFHVGATLTTEHANFGYSSAKSAEPPVGLGRTCKVGSYKPNAWGLHDMHGNVREWCSDFWEVAYYDISPPRDPTGPATGTSHVVRGGAWNLPASLCRSAYRWHSSMKTSGLSNYGLRVVCEVK